MSLPVRARLAALALSAAAPLTLLLAAPAASADQQRVPPGLTSLPDPSVAVAHAPPATTAHGRKLR